MITRLEEKRGGRVKLDCESTHFKNYIHNNRLIDMEFSNGVYTWNNRRIDAHQIASRLDRFLLSDNAIHLGGDLLASILPLSGSDHWQRSGDNVRRPFRFEAFWLNHPYFNNLITETWKNFTSPEGTKMYKFQQKLKNLKEKIKQWNRSTFAIEKIIKIIPKIITEEHNQILLRPISLQEVEIAMRQLKVGKEPGLDGFTSDFFHNFWDLIKEEVWQVVNRWMLPSLNATFIALIPKEENSQTPDKF
eukprot:PITA_04577